MRSAVYYMKHLHKQKERYHPVHFKENNLIDVHVEPCCDGKFFLLSFLCSVHFPILDAPHIDLSDIDSTFDCSSNVDSFSCCSASI
jgi:hypothetical protein